MPEPESIDRICPALEHEYSDLWWEQPHAVLVELARGRSRGRIVAISEEDIKNLIEDFTAVLLPRWEEAARLETLQREVALLKGRCAVLERLSPILVPIESFAPEPYEVVKPLHAVVRYQNEQYIASFFDANLSASGDTQVEAVLNLKDIIAGTFEILTTLQESELGPGPLQQRKVLEEFVQKKD